MFTTNKKNTHCKRLSCNVALEYGLKDLPCSTEWIDVNYKSIRDLLYTVWSHYISVYVPEECNPIRNEN